MTPGGLMIMLEQMSVRQRFVAGLALLAAVAAFFAILRIATEPSMALLYSGLDPAAAGDVVQSLEQQGARFEIRGGAIFVDSSSRDSLRMTLAAEGKPANGTAGYELLDSLSGFGTTSQMFDVAYWRAKEGELARTIMSSPLVRSARVHISNVESRPFARPRAMSASVSLLPSSGTIPPEQAAAFRFLVSSAVAGLEPSGVTVIDVRSGAVVSGDNEDLTRSGDRRADELRRRAERLLEARVGRGNAVVEVSVETVTESEQIRQRTLDPDTRVLISSEVEERASAATGTGSAPVTVASNLPDGDAGADAPQSTSDETETRERSNFEVSETTRELLRGPGGIQRITVAVLVNDAVAGADGTESVRTEEELAALRELVASAVGLNEERGDVVTIQAMSFSSPEQLLGEAGTVLDALLAGVDLMRLIQLAVLAAVALILALFVVRPILAAAANAPRRVGQLPNYADAQAVAGPDRGLPALPMPTSAGSPDAAQRLVRTVGGRQSDAANVLRDWMKTGGNA